MGDYNFIVETGVIVPDTSDQLAQVPEYRTAFGDDLDVSPETPQGVLIAAETESRDSVARNNAALANQINPTLPAAFSLTRQALAGGARCRPHRRLSAALSSAACQALSSPRALSPVSGRTVCASPRRARSFLMVSDRASGFSSPSNWGAFPAAVGALNTIVTGVLGWETVNNP